MKTFLKKIYSLSGSIYIPKAILDENALVLHISDTPPSLYGAIEKLIEKTNPICIIHTGNFASNFFTANTIKSEDQYLKACKKIIDVFDNSNAREVYGVFGNYDSPRTLTSISKNIKWIDEYADIKIDNIQFRISHTPQYAASTQAEFSLFGHDLEILSCQTKEHSFLNGIENINLISTKSRIVSQLNYPIGTNETRQNLIHVSV